MNFDWLHKGTQLQDHLQNDHQNNFTLIRLIAALIVAKQHSFTHASPNDPTDFMSVFHVSALGLPSFFLSVGFWYRKASKSADPGRVFYGNDFYAYILQPAFLSYPALLF